VEEFSEHFCFGKLFANPQNLQLATEEEEIVPQGVQKLTLEQCCRSGSRSARIGIILPVPDPHPWSAEWDLDPDTYPFQLNVKLNYIFQENFKMLSNY
jgi:hypothetical protein